MEASFSSPSRRCVYHRYRSVGIKLLVSHWLMLAVVTNFCEKIIFSLDNCNSNNKTEQEKLSYTWRWYLLRFFMLMKQRSLSCHWVFLICSAVLPHSVTLRWHKICCHCAANRQLTNSISPPHISEVSLWLIQGCSCFSGKANGIWQDAVRLCSMHLSVFVFSIGK